MLPDLIQITKDALWLVLLLSAPPILVASVVGLLVAFLQAATQMQEQTFAYAVKFLAIVLSLFLTAAFVGGTLFNFTDRLFLEFPGMVR
jgi:flagellar biosynthetic protein FliQ/type III secretion protein S